VLEKAAAAEQLATTRTTPSRRRSEIVALPYGAEFMLA
jgi:hypothetical protein